MLALAAIVAATQCQPRNVGPGSLRRVLRRIVCARIRKTPAGDVVADRCTPRATISLTTLGG